MLEVDRRRGSACPPVQAAHRGAQMTRFGVLAARFFCVLVSSILVSSILVSFVFLVAVPAHAAVMPAGVGSRRADEALKLTVETLTEGASTAAKVGQLSIYRARLDEALSGAIARKAPKVVGKFAATDTGTIALFQWRLLSMLEQKPEELATLSQQHANSLAWLLANPAALELFLTSGDVEGDRWGDAVRIFAEIAAADPTVLEKCDDAKSPPLALRLAIATALTHATPVRWMADGSTIDPVKRYQSFRMWEKEGVLFPSFSNLTAWELRYVVGSWSSDDDLVWARANIKPELKVRDKVGDAAHMLGYNLVNKRGVSVQEGGKFYDNKPMTLAVMLEYGGVCGAISRFGSSMSQAFGVPAMPVGQPGHCAFIWQQQPTVWAINNDISGWAESNRHDGIHITWASNDVGSAAWLIPLMQDAQRDLPNFAQSESVRHAAAFADPDDRAGVFAEACELSPCNFAAWAARFTALATPTTTKNAKSVRSTKPAAWKDALADAAKALARQPLAFDVLVRVAEPALLPTGPSAKTSAKLRAQHAEGVARTALAMLASGADLGLADALVRNATVRQARELGVTAVPTGATSECAARQQAFARGEMPAAGAALCGGKSVSDALELGFGVVGVLDVAKDGAAHELWRRSVARVGRGAVLCEEFREMGLRRIESMIAALGRAGRADDARWLADRLVEAAKQLKEALPTDTRAAELEAKLAAFRASLG